MSARPAVTLVLGDVDLVRALALAGLPCAVFATPHDPVRWSRHPVERLPWIDHWRRQADLAAALGRWASAQPEPPVAMPQTDGDLLTLSRHRDRLAPVLRLPLAEAPLIEDLVDKGRFAALAARLGLPVPRGRLLDPAATGPAGLDLRPPYVIKPAVRDATRWSRAEPSAKALPVATERALGELWPRLADTGLEVLVQEAVPGPESRIESFHAYVDGQGALVAAFTGRKIRTRPASCGHTTALELTAADDVAGLGREVVDALGLRGVAKADFKRAPDGSLHLLEVNPRFTLWHHPAALAGLNVPAIVHADLTGRPRPPIGRARPGVRWMLPLGDVRAAHAQGVPLRRWLRFAAACEARSGAAADDPGPLAGAVLAPVRRRVRRR